MSRLLEEAEVLRAEGKFPEAVVCYRKALQLDPATADIYLKLGKCLLKQRRTEVFAVSLGCLRKSLELEPDNPAVYVELAELFHQLGKYAEALKSVRKALELNPAYVPAYFSQLHILCSVVYEDETGIAAARQAYGRALAEMNGKICLDNPEAVESAAEAVGKYPFYLAYQAENDCRLQQQYGKLICRIQAAKYPQWSRPLKPDSRRAGRRIRVGIVSAFFSRHANWKMRIHGWLEKLDRERFDIYGYYTGRHPDQFTDIARQKCLRFVENDFSIPSLCQKIAADQLDVLIYPEIGMNKIVVKLSSLRLAPVQCVTWGHPNTSGLPTIDYFLSSDLMEPEGAEAHYSETLVRLPNLSVYYPPLPQPETTNISRDDLGLKADAVLYLCLQSLAKYLPQHDDLLPRIAREVENCQFVFLTRNTTPALLNLFKRRLRQAFARHDLNSDEYLVFLPFLNPEKYDALNRLGDVYLDSIGWSGCNTTLEALACDLPVVTRPDKMMRGRHTLAFLRMMGITETIADSSDDYVEIAVQLGRDLKFRTRIEREVAENKDRLYCDMESIRELESFLVTSVEKGCII